MEAKCVKCGLKSVEDFHKCYRNKNGLQSKCKDCRKKRKQPREYSKRYYDEHKEKKLLYSKKRYENHKEEISEWAKKYRLRASVRYRNRAKDAKERSLKFDLEFEDFCRITSETCFYCGEFDDGKEFCGLDRLDNDKGYVLENIVSCCEFCNRAKWIWTREKFIDKIKKISERNRLIQT